ncbi:hypothetical protein BJ944DRAFT_273650 [Cunninghamella echinulata]|nr:hypothetical protein BJ944DRAFT_273650 [Cunninghamella echinulata]
MQRDFICTHMDCPLSVIPTLTQPLPPFLDKNTKRKYRSLQIINKKGKKNDSKASLDNLIQPNLQSLSKIDSKKGSSRWEKITLPNRAIDYDQCLFNNIVHVDHHINDRNHYNNNNNQQSYTSNHDIKNNTSTIHSLQHIDYFHLHNSHHHMLVHHKRKKNETGHIWSMTPSPTSNFPNRFSKTRLLLTTNGKENTSMSDSSPSMTSSSQSHFNNNSNKKNVYAQDSMVHWDKKKNDQRLPMVEFNNNKQTITGLKMSKNSDKSILSEKKNEKKSYGSYLDTVQEGQEKKNTHDTICTCAHYFGNNSTSFANVKETMDKFSKHKVVYERSKTPPGFWDLTFSVSPEKRQQ